MKSHRVYMQCAINSMPQFLGLAFFFLRGLVDVSHFERATSGTWIVLLLRLKSSVEPPNTTWFDYLTTSMFLFLYPCHFSTVYVLITTRAYRVAFFYDQTFLQ